MQISIPLRREFVHVIFVIHQNFVTSSNICSGNQTPSFAKPTKKKAGQKSPSSMAISDNLNRSMSRSRYLGVLTKPNLALELLKE